MIFSFSKRTSRKLFLICWAQTWWVCLPTISLAVLSARVRCDRSIYNYLSSRLGVTLCFGWCQFLSGWILPTDWMVERLVFRVLSTWKSRALPWWQLLARKKMQFTHVRTQSVPNVHKWSPRYTLPFFNWHLRFYDFRMTTWWGFTCRKLIIFGIFTMLLVQNMTCFSCRIWWGGKRWNLRYIW